MIAAAAFLGVLFAAALAALIKMNRRDLAAAIVDNAAAIVDGSPEAADPWDGATEDWSPTQASAAAEEDLTPTGMLKKEAVRLDDGSVVGTPDTPTYTEIGADVEHGFDKHWTDALAESRWRIEMLVAAAQSGKSVRAAWAEIPTGAYPLVAVAA